MSRSTYRSKGRNSDRIQGEYIRGMTKGIARNLLTFLCVGTVSIIIMASSYVS